MTDHDFDAIVVGSGISGGWAAKELTEKGFEDPGARARQTAGARRGLHGRAPTALGNAGPGVYRCATSTRTNTRFNAPATPSMRPPVISGTTTQKNPYDYQPKRPFEWLRADVVGGRSTLWARQVYRWSDLDFEANLKDGHGSDWPIRYADIAPWYSHVERFIGVSGSVDGIPQLPDGEFLKPMSMNVLERHAAELIEAEFPERRMTIGRCAVLTEPLAGSDRGCLPLLRSLSSGLLGGVPTFPASARRCLQPSPRAICPSRQIMVVEGLDFDESSGRISGVRGDRYRDSRSPHHQRAPGISLCLYPLAAPRFC